MRGREQEERERGGQGGALKFEEWRLRLETDTGARNGCCVGFYASFPRFTLIIALISYHASAFLFGITDTWIFPISKHAGLVHASR